MQREGTELNLNWFESMLYGLFSGLMDILPGSAQVHRTLMLKFFGIRGDLDLLHLMIHLSICAALYLSCRKHLIRMRRARALARVPKKKRKRPLDMRSMMDSSMLRTMLIPAVLGLLLYRRANTLNDNLMLLCLFLMLNGVILYLPQFMATGNRDSRTLSRVEGFLMGFGGAVSVVPGFSAMGVTTAIGSVCGVERTYGLTLALMMNLVLNAGYAVYDVLAILENGLGLLSFMILLRYLFTAAVTFGGAMLAIRVMRHLSENRGYTGFAFYSFGQALFTFIFNLMA